jgi:hypothetical protein
MVLDRQEWHSWLLSLKKHKSQRFVVGESLFFELVIMMWGIFLLKNPVKRYTPPLNPAEGTIMYGI